MTYITCPEKKRLLEIGCGTGGNLQYLFSEFQERIGLDYDAKAIKYAGQKLANTVQYLRGDANHLCFRESAVDCVAMLDVLYHKNIPDINEVLRQANRVLTPKGYLLISDGAFSFLQGRHNKAVHAARRFTRQELVSTLLQMNYRIVKASYWGIALFFLLFLKRAVFENLVPASGKNVNAYDLVKIPVVDSLLYWCVQSEQYFLKKYSFPLGASIAILAQKS
ncbi:MAG: class I SAM-dependent methyltransferase [bacterium]|nr:class I SAM-dependent methyltransferase [bacterium]